MNFSVDHSQRSSTQSLMKLNVFVFKTNIKTKEDITVIRPLLNSLEDITAWSINRNDCGHVLRVTGAEITSDKVVELIEDAGYVCDKLLPDFNELATKNNFRETETGLIDILSYACPGGLRPERIGKNCRTDIHSKKQINRKQHE